MGEKAKVTADIDAEDRNVMHGKMSGRTQDGPVSPKHHSEVGQGVRNSQQPREGIDPGTGHGRGHICTARPQLLRTMTCFPLSRLAIGPVNHPDPIKTHDPSELPVTSAAG